jgi:hypothetical protein
LGLWLVLPPVVGGCFHYKDVEKDRDRQPVIMTGVSGMIIDPSQNPATLPPLPPVATRTSRAGATTSGNQASTTPGTGQRSSSGVQGMPSPGSGPVFIGGNEGTIQQRRRERREPSWYNPFWFPVAVVLFPIRAAREVFDYARGEPEVPVAPSETPPPNLSSTDRERLQAAHEKARLKELERQLGRGVGPSGPGAAGTTGPALGSESAPTIAEELAALRGGRSSPAPIGQEHRVASKPSPREPVPSSESPAVADRVEDRDGDGRPDFWVYRRDGRVVRERFDDDGDQTPDRSVFYDPQTEQRVRIEEDANRDGQVDTWTYYQHGQLVRRRVDRDGDGNVDAWTFYAGEQIQRHEEDTDSDGFRDRVDFYQGGVLARREEDSNGDGRPDRITEFDTSGAPSRVEEDRDGDGRVDVRSHYHEGRLSRRELLTELAAREGEAAGANAEGEAVLQPPLAHTR